MAVAYADRFCRRWWNTPKLRKWPGSTKQFTGSYAPETNKIVVPFQCNTVVNMNRHLQRLKRTQQKSSKKRTRLRASAFKERIVLDLSQFEDQKDKTFLEKIGKQAAMNAINENKALGIPVTFWENGQVVRRMPDGQVQPLQQSTARIEIAPGRKLKKGTIIHVRTSTH